MSNPMNKALKKSKVQPVEEDALYLECPCGNCVWAITSTAFVCAQCSVQISHSGNFDIEAINELLFQSIQEKGARPQPSKVTPVSKPRIITHL